MRFEERLGDNRDLANIVRKELDDFNFKNWNLVMASVSPETYRRVDSAWERNFDGYPIRVVIGPYLNLLTIILMDNRLVPLNEFVQKGDTSYEKTDEVNRLLMKSV
jgi:hypothetical protein